MYMSNLYGYLQMAWIGSPLLIPIQIGCSHCIYHILLKCQEWYKSEHRQGGSLQQLGIRKTLNTFAWCCQVLIMTFCMLSACY